jgi:hypothetical protein
MTAQAFLDDPGFLPIRPPTAPTSVASSKDLKLRYDISACHEACS